MRVAYSLCGVQRHFMDYYACWLFFNQLSYFAGVNETTFGYFLYIEWTVIHMEWGAAGILAQWHKNCKLVRQRNKLYIAVSNPWFCVWWESMCIISAFDIYLFTFFASRCCGVMLY